MIKKETYTECSKELRVNWWTISTIMRKIRKEPRYLEGLKAKEAEKSEACARIKQTAESILNSGDNISSIDKIK